MEIPPIRLATEPDTPAIRALYAQAFPQEDLLPLLSVLLGRDDVLSLVAISEDSLATQGNLVAQDKLGAQDMLSGHAAFTTCSVSGMDAPVALLGPVAIAPEYQRQGIGTALIKAGLERMKTAGIARVFVLGDPAYYEQLQFTTETSVTPPHGLPDEWAGAWQSQSLGTHPSAPSGRLQVPAPWQPKALWAP
ncbi:MAG: N-acetyltransferase [Pseudomonadota bacterium]